MSKASRLVVLVVLLASASAEAFVLSTGAIVRRLGAHRDEMQLFALVLHGAFFLGPGEAKKAAEGMGIPLPADGQFAAVVSYKLPGRCRVELEPGQAKAKEIPSVINTNGKLAASGIELESLQTFARIVCPLLYQRGPAETEKGLYSFLRESGIDPAVVSLGRTPVGVAYVIGGKPKEQLPTLWIEKDHFWPAKFVARGEGALEVRLNDYSSPVSGEWHPRAVELRKGGELFSRFVAEKAEVNQKLNDALF